MTDHIQNLNIFFAPAKKFIVCPSRVATYIHINNVITVCLFLNSIAWFEPPVYGFLFHSLLSSLHFISFIWISTLFNSFTVFCFSDSKHRKLFASYSSQFASSLPFEARVNFKSSRNYKTNDLFESLLAIMKQELNLSLEWVKYDGWTKKRNKLKVYIKMIHVNEMYGSQ